MKKSVGVLFSILAFVLLISLISLASADETDVVIKGMKGYVWNVTLNVINPSTGNLIISLENDTVAATGLANFRYSSATQTVTYYVVARNNGKIIGSRSSASVGNFSTGAGLTTIDLFPEISSTTTANIIVDTAANQSDDTDSSDNVSSLGNATTIDLGNSFSFSGAFSKIKSGLKASAKWILYGIIILIAIGGIVLGIIWWMRRPQPKPYEFTRKSENVVMSGDDERPVVQGRKIEDELASAEQKIKEAQEEIARIKNKKNKLNDAKQRYEQAKKDLEEVEDEY